MGITTQFNVQLAKRLIPFSRGETLLVAGYWQKDEWRSKKEGKNIYMIVAEFVIAQPDYSQFYAVEDGGEGMEEETDDVGF